MGYTTDLEMLLAARDGTPESLHRIIEFACERLRRMARRMLQRFPLVRKFSETDDILNEAVVSLIRSVGVVRPDSVRKFFGLAATQIRRELLNIVRQRPERKGFGRGDEVDGVTKTDFDEPHSLAEWTEFHRLADELPIAEREVFALVWYSGLAHSESAFVLGVSIATVKRRWQSARLMMQEKLKGGEPS